MNIIEQKIQKLEENREDWNISLDTKEFLINFINQNKLESVLEIGTFNGYSALVFSLLAKEVVTIDKSPEFLPEAKKNLEGVENVSILEGDAKEILPKLLEQGKKFNLIFIDAMKKEYVKYLKFALELVSEKGIIIADNTMSHKDRLGAFFDYLRKLLYSFQHKNIYLQLG